LRACPPEIRPKPPPGTAGYSRPGSYHEDRTARATDDPIGDALREGSSYPPAVPAPHDDQICLQLLCERDDLLGRFFLS
jgi:hypothetical protein